MEDVLCEIFIQVAPSGIHFPDEINLPLPFPLLHPLLFQDRLLHRVVCLIPDETVEAVAFGKSLDEFLLVGPDASREIGGDANVEGSVRFVGDDVDAGGLGIGWHGREASY